MDHRHRHRALRTGAVAALVLGTLSAALAAAPASAAAPVVDPFDDGRAGEVLVTQVTPSSTGTLVVTAPDDAAVVAVFGQPNCTGVGTAVLSCGSDTRVWNTPFFVGVQTAVDAPLGPLAGGSVAFTVGGTTVDTAPLALTVVAPWTADGRRGGSATVVIGRSGYSGTLRFTAPAGTRIAAITDASSCVVAADGASADCGNGVWNGPRSVVLAVDADAPFGTAAVGRASYDAGSVVSSTPYTVRVLPDTPTVSAVEATAVDRAELRGTGVDGAIVEVRDPEGTVLGTVPVTDGSWLLTVAAPPGAALSVTQSTSGVTSAAATVAVPLPAPVVTAPEGNGTVEAGGTLTGTAYPGSTVDVRIDGTLVGSVLAGPDGAWAFAVPDTVTAGRHAVVVTARLGVLEAESDTVTFTLEAEATVPPPGPGPDPTPGPEPTPGTGTMPGSGAGARTGAGAGAGAGSLDPGAPADGALASTGATGVVAGGVGSALLLAVGATLLLLRRRTRFAGRG